MEREQKHQKASVILDQLRECLGLSQEDLGAMFGVDGEAAGAWESGSLEIPEIAFARVIAAHAALDRMIWLLRPDRLPEVIRRRAAAFDGERALDWILKGRIAEVAERYEGGLANVPPAE